MVTLAATLATASVHIKASSDGLPCSVVESIYERDLGERSVICLRRLLARDGDLPALSVNPGGKAHLTAETTDGSIRHPNKGEFHSGTVSCEPCSFPKVYIAGISYVTMYGAYCRRGCQGAIWMEYHLLVINVHVNVDQAGFAQCGIQFSEHAITKPPTHTAFRTLLMACWPISVIPTRL